MAKIHEYRVGGCVVYSDFVLSDELTAEYIRQAEKRHNRKLDQLTLESDGEFVGCHYVWRKVPFERIRRITGYLVGTMGKWNNAKKAEEADRVKHS